MPPPIAVQHNSPFSTLSPRPIHSTSSKTISEFVFPSPSTSIPRKSNPFFLPPADSPPPLDKLTTPPAPHLPPDVLESFGESPPTRDCYVAVAAEDDDARSTRSDNCDSRPPLYYPIPGLEGHPYLGSRFSDATTTTSGHPSTFRQTESSLSPLPSPLPPPRLTRRASAPSLLSHSSPPPRSPPPQTLAVRPSLTRMLSSSTQTTSEHDSLTLRGSVTTGCTSLSPSLPTTALSHRSSEDAEALLELQVAIEPVVFDARENNLATVFAWQASNVLAIERDGREERERMKERRVRDDAVLRARRWIDSEIKAEETDGGIGAQGERGRELESEVGGSGVRRVGEAEMWVRRGG